LGGSRGERRLRGAGRWRGPQTKGSGEVQRGLGARERRRAHHLNLCGMETRWRSTNEDPIEASRNVLNGHQRREVISTGIKRGRFRMFGV